MSDKITKISIMAKTGNILGIITLLIYIFFIRFTYGARYFVPRFTCILIFASLTFVLGICAYIKISRSKGEIGGRSWAICAILEGIIFLVIGYIDLLSVIKILSGDH